MLGVGRECQRAYGKDEAVVRILSTVLLAKLALAAPVSDHNGTIIAKPA